jgi:hypothetical protein
MDDVARRLDQHDRDIQRLTKGYDEVKSELKTLTAMTSSQNVELRTQTGQLQNIKDWQDGISRALWIIVTPLLGMVGLGLVVLIAVLIWKGVRP